MPRAASTSERPFRFLAAGPGLALVLALAACGRETEGRVEHLVVFGSSADIEVRGSDPASTQAALAEASARLAALDREWHAWEPSDLTRINAAFAAGVPAEAPPSVLDLVERSRPLVEASQGLFDPAIGQLIADWGFHTSTFPVVSPAPTEARLDAWRADRPRLRDIVRDGTRLSSRHPAARLDFGAVAEGAAAEIVLDLFRRHGVRHALVGLGGDIVALGNAGGRPWRAAVRDPFGGVLGTVELRDGDALFSTGNYNKFRTSPSGARWPHILDPRTGHPARGAAAVVVLHPDAVLADAAATATFVAGPAGFERIARRMGLGCVLMVTEENEMLVTRAMAERLVLARRPVPLGPPLDLGPGCRVAG